MSVGKSSPQSSNRADLWVLWGGIAFSLVFTAIIWAAGQRLEGIPFLPDTGPSWYYWQLPEPDTWARITAWGFYAVHQITIWGLIYLAQKRIQRVQPGLHRLNLIALAVNAFFIILHFVQTHVWYDGLAQDVSIWTSQGSVILMLVLILIMENKRRGLFFGKKAPLPQRAMDVVRQYHGYVFAWATVYTLWYHPMEDTSGHLIGFFYMFLLLLQGSLFYTRIHVNRWWMLVQEATVLVHGALVAVMQGNGLWPMFAFGFGGVFVITQMHGLKLPKWARWALLGVYVVAALVVYAQPERRWVDLNEIIRIPIIEYLLVFVLAWLIGGVLWVARRVKGESATVST